MQQDEFCPVCSKNKKGCFSQLLMSCCSVGSFRPSYDRVTQKVTLFLTRAGVAGSHGRGMWQVRNRKPSFLLQRHLGIVTCIKTLSTKVLVHRKRNALRALRPSLSLTRQSLIQVPSLRLEGSEGSEGLGIENAACALRPLV